MKFIHTGDWRLGKALRERPLSDDQAFTLGGLGCRLAEEPEPHWQVGSDARACA